jgi:hypothetical protein
VKPITGSIPILPNNCSGSKGLSRNPIDPQILALQKKRNKFWVTVLYFKSHGQRPAEKTTLQFRAVHHRPWVKANCNRGTLTFTLASDRLRYANPAILPSTKTSFGRVLRRGNLPAFAPWHYFVKMSRNRVSMRHSGFRRKSF